MRDRGRILIVDDGSETVGRGLEVLRGGELGSILIASPAEAMAKIDTEQPGVVLFGLAGEDLRNHPLLHRIRQHPEHADISVLFLIDARARQQVARAFEVGADDCIVEPFEPAELLARVRGQQRLQRSVERLARDERDLKTVVQLTQALASSLDIRDILYTIVRRIAELVEVDRCSMVLAHENSEVGYVIATSDDIELRDLPISLSKYPEIREVLSTRRPLCIDDIAGADLFREVREEPGMDFRSLALVPLVHEEQPLGVIFLRAKRQDAFAGESLTWVHTLANAAAIAIRNARLLQSLRSASEEDAQARLNAERRVRLFQRYADFFESAADGMVVTDHAGHVLFANPKAREIIGIRGEDSARAQIRSLLAAEDAERIDRLMVGFREGIYPQGVDVRAYAPDGSRRVLSINSSSVLRAEHAVLFTFRDVTAERSTELELLHTKEFLERVIESSVDAIVSSDLQGKVLLFNRAAARIFGYSPEDVIGKMSVEMLYPPGVAKDVMRKIRAPEHGGENRLEEYRVDMLSSGGELIPVKISAALIFEKDRPVGSVGIFTDVREALRMEAELMRALEDLREREKGAAVAHLAGATAHELNQPLTSVIGYAELLLRHLDTTSPLHNAADVIIVEAQRMAEIVRKIGKITKYETMSYVGGAQILDLDKASADSSRKRVS